MMATRHSALTAPEAGLYLAGFGIATLCLLEGTAAILPGASLVLPTSGFVDGIILIGVGLFALLWFLLIAGLLQAGRAA